MLSPLVVNFFFFNDTATTEISTLSLHDALPILPPQPSTSAAPPPLPAALVFDACNVGVVLRADVAGVEDQRRRSEEHTSELQSQSNLVCRLLLEKKKKEEMNNCLVSHPTRT